MLFRIAQSLFIWIPILFAIPVEAQILKYPGDECSTKLRDNNLCVRNSACVQTGVHELNNDPKMQCMCAGGRIKDPQLFCSDCNSAKVGYQCGANAVCQHIPAINAHRCVCQGESVRNHTANDGSCIECIVGEYGFESFCDRGECKDDSGVSKCECFTGYLKDPVNNTCIQCKDSWLPEIRCNETYANTSCFLDSVSQDHFCLCPKGFTYDTNHQCAECDDVTAPCRLQEQCIEGRDRLDPAVTHSYCYEPCDAEEDTACNPRATQKLCTVAELDLGDTNICRCQNGFIQLDDGTCISASEQLNCYTCNHTESCTKRQAPDSNYFETCQVGDFCWTTANWYWNFDTRVWENITYRRECHSNPCKNADEDFCMDDPYHEGHHVCVTCCTTGLCNAKQLAPVTAATSSLKIFLPFLFSIVLNVFLLNF